MVQNKTQQIKANALVQLDKTSPLLAELLNACVVRLDKLY